MLLQMVLYCSWSCCNAEASLCRSFCGCRHQWGEHQQRRVVAVQVGDGRLHAGASRLLLRRHLWSRLAHGAHPARAHAIILC